MLKRISLLAATGLLAAACASDPAAAPSAGGAASTTPAAAAAPLVNIAATSQWLAEERLMPQDPILALVNAGGTIESPAGFYMTCNPANGTITAHLGKQPTTRVGQSATYRIRMGAEAKSVEGKFQTNPKAADADFVFPLQSIDIRTMAQLDMVSVLTDQGEVQWAFVRDPAAQVNAKYVASLKGLAQQSLDYFNFCNPK
ncbi:MAG TPA: hypothetical protein VFV70_12230 [Hyphomonadaceae bacterium]|nr:hypothetical protein [Hyphomonadaceae bacterium]